MKVYIPFFIVSICVVILLRFFYNPIDDVIIKLNMYEYSKESYNEIKKQNLDIDSYYMYIDCFVTSNNFKVNNLKFYKTLNSCDYDINKVNYLLNYFNEKEVLFLIEKEFNYKLVDKKNYKDVLKYVSDKYFLSENLQRYLTYNGKNVVLSVNLNYDLDPYTNYNEIVDVNVLTLINKYNKLVNLNKLSYCSGYYVFSVDMCNSLKQFLQNITDEGIEFSIESAMKRDDLFDEHATGLAINIVYDYTYESLIESIACKYGFILRYKQEYSDILDVVENGHYRYVGEFSEDIYNSKVSLDEYTYILK